MPKNAIGYKEKAQIIVIFKDLHIYILIADNQQQIRLQSFTNE